MMQQVDLGKTLAKIRAVQSELGKERNVYPVKKDPRCTTPE